MVLIEVLGVIWHRLKLNKRHSKQNRLANNSYKIRNKTDLQNTVITTVIELETWFAKMLKHG